MVERRRKGGGNNNMNNNNMEVMLTRIMVMLMTMDAMILRDGNRRIYGSNFSHLYIKLRIRNMKF